MFVQNGNQPFERIELLKLIEQNGIFLSSLSSLSSIQPIQPIQYPVHPTYPALPAFTIFAAILSIGSVIDSAENSFHFTNLKDSI